MGLLFNKYNKIIKYLNLKTIWKKLNKDERKKFMEFLDEYFNGTLKSEHARKELDIKIPLSNRSILGTLGTRAFVKAENNDNYYDDQLTKLHEKIADKLLKEIVTDKSYLEKSIDEQEIEYVSTLLNKYFRN